MNLSIALLDEKAVPQKAVEDAYHIAMATVHDILFISRSACNYLPPPYTIFGKGEENSSRNEVKTFWLRLRKVEMAAWIRA